MAMGNSHPNMLDPDGGFGKPRGGAGIGGSAASAAASFAAPTVQGAGFVGGPAGATAWDNIGYMNYGGAQSIGGAYGDLKLPRLIPLENGGVISVNQYIGWGGEAGTARIDITYIPPDGNTSYVNWFQTIHTNDDAQYTNEGKGQLGDYWFVDPQYDDPQKARFFYHWNSDLPSGGGKGVFTHIDPPTRKINKKGSVYMDLETSLAELQSDGTYKNLGTLSWGFRINRDGSFSLKPLKLNAPSVYHASKFAELNKP
jgi:hypothetical protein